MWNSNQWFPQGLENRGKNNGQGKVREFYFGLKVAEKSWIFLNFRPKVRVFFSRITRFLCQIFLCIVSRLWYTVNKIGVRIHNWVVLGSRLKRKTFSNEYFMVWMWNYNTNTSFWLSRIVDSNDIWSGENCRKSGKCQGISFSRSCGNPANERKLFVLLFLRYYWYIYAF